MHLVITTREDPNLPLARLRVRSQLTELRANDLRFTDSEAVGFLNQVMDLNLSAEEISSLETRTEGWIAGLQMAALSMQGRADSRNRSARLYRGLPIGFLSPYWVWLPTYRFRLSIGKKRVFGYYSAW